jgi:hypothetical protein
MSESNKEIKGHLMYWINYLLENRSSTGMSNRKFISTLSELIIYYNNLEVK